MAKDAAMFERHEDMAHSVAPSITLTEKDTLRFLSKVDKPEGDGCWNWLDASWKSNGYGCFTIKSHPVRAHRIAYQIAFGSPGKMSVLHKCDNRRCVRPDHLFLGTHQDNMDDMARKGRAASGKRHRAHLHPDTIRRGSSNGNSRLTEDQVLEIRSLFPSKSARQLGAIYGVSRIMIRKILNREAWFHI